MKFKELEETTIKINNDIVDNVIQLMNQFSASKLHSFSFFFFSFRGRFENDYH